MDHEMMRDYGEALALYKPVLSYKPVQKDYKIDGVPEITLKYLTPHHKNGVLIVCTLIANKC